MNFTDELKQFKESLAQEFNLVSNENIDENTGLSVERIGKFTGSGLKKLMTCKSSSKKTDWSMKDKLVDFGDTALNYCLEKACERNTGYSIETPTTWEMNWGTKHEPIARKKIEEKFKCEAPEQEFMYFLKNAGCTPDSFIDQIELGIQVLTDINVEIKCPPKFLNHAKYLNQPVNESHEYFWQIQGEMMAQSKHRGVDCNKTLFQSFHPSFKGEAALGGNIVVSSPLHQRALIIRCIIGERIINNILADGFLKEPVSYLKDVIKDIPDDDTKIDEWLNVAIKEVEL